MKPINSILLFAVILVSCTQTEHKVNREGTLKTANVVKVITDTIKPPRIVLLNTCPKPQRILIPKSSGSYYIIQSASGPQRIELKPPLVSPSTNINRNHKRDRISKQHVVGMGFFTNLTTEQGLPIDEIISSCIDHFGNLWFGTIGVNRYDGKSFTNYSTLQGLANNDVKSIIEDKSGNLWFGTAGGLSKYDGKSFSNFNTSQGLVNNDVRCNIEDKKGNLWFGTSNGVSRYDGKSFVNYSTVNGLPNNFVWCIKEDKKGNIWFGTSNGVSRYNGKYFTNYSVLNGLANNNIRSITEDKSGNIWFGTYGGGVSRYNGISFNNYSVLNGLANNFVLTSLEDKKGNIWFGTQFGGVSRYDGKSFTNYTTIQGLANNDVRNILEDNSGNIWFGTWGGGINCFAGKSFTNYTTVQGLPKNWVNSIIEDNRGNFWIGTYGGGVCKYDGNSFTTYTTSQGLANNVVRIVVEDKKGNIWFGTEGDGVSKFDGISFTNYTTSQGLVNNIQNSILEDKNGNIWFSSDSGISKFDGKSFINFTTTQGLPSNLVGAIMEDKKGNIWFGTRSGVSIYNGKFFTNFSTSEGLIKNWVISITEDKMGNIWFGTVEGLSVLTLENRKKLLEKGTGNLNENEIDYKHLFTNFTTANGLPDNLITQVLEADDRKLYLGTNLGICEVNIPKEPGKVPKIGQIFNSSTGYPVKDVNWGQNTMYKDSKGIIWIGTGSDKTALVRFDPGELYKNPNPPNLLIQNIRINEESIDWYQISKTIDDSLVKSQQERIIYGKTLLTQERDSLRKRFSHIQFDSISKFYPIPKNLILPYDFNHISFEFAAIEPSRPYLVNYQYILDGYENKWSPITHKTDVSFGNMNEGNYTFRLKAQSPDGVWSKPVVYSFKVLPPWYRHWFAYFIYFVLAILSSWLFIKWRFRKLRRDKILLEEKVEERTNDLQIKTNELEIQKQKSDDLLLNILPEEIAEELKQKGSSEARQYQNVTVLFTDFVNFTGISGQLSPAELVAEIHKNFTAFDSIIEKHGLEKIKTIGDAYMAVCGLPNEDLEHALKVIKASIDIKDYILKSNSKFQIRIGVNSGPVVAGIVGVKKYAYDIWGDTVNMAARMEQNSEAGKVNISSTTYELVKDKFNCTYRGKIGAKNKGEVDMYYVIDLKEH